MGPSLAHHTMNLIKERSAHFYTSKGEPLYEVKSKSQPGMRPFTMRDARLMNPLPYPSVTTILQVIAKPALEAWKIEQGIMAALTLPREREALKAWMDKWDAFRVVNYPLGVSPSQIEELQAQWAYQNPPKFAEPEDAFAHRVVEDMEEQVSEAADFGRKIHHGIERLLQSDTEIEPEIMPWMEHIMKWLTGNVDNVIGAEECFAHPAGYAGRYDLVGQLKGHGVAVVDFKTQKFKNGKGPVFYDEWALQLSAYSAAVCHNKGIFTDPALVSVVINSEKPEPPVMKIWKDPLNHFSAFVNAFGVWKYLKNYDPLNHSTES